MGSFGAAIQNSKFKIQNSKFKIQNSKGSVVVAGRSNEKRG
jgi:hypothetical protein